PDSLTASVAVESADPHSLLNLYRRLIHLRRSNAALATGTLIPLDAGSPQAVAYVRRAGMRAVLVVANLGDSALSGLTVASAAHALAPGRYAARSLLGGQDGAALRVGADGRIAGYVPAPAVAARQSLVLSLVRR
ncbi:MAG TPA: DUF3459 domain-containing protein, partial [Gemmatimonadales bacterium]|nr:DUF3459 domain-containing protein [Gemmatimonadales bacterium]